MKATVMYGAHDVRVENVPDARLVQPTDALVRVTRACICGSDLWPYNSMPPTETGSSRMGHEFVGIVEAVGSAVGRAKISFEITIDPGKVAYEGSVSDNELRLTVTGTTGNNRGKQSTSARARAFAIPHQVLGLPRRCLVSGSQRTACVAPATELL